MFDFIPLVLIVILQLGPNSNASPSVMIATGNYGIIMGYDWSSSMQNPTVITKGKTISWYGSGDSEQMNMNYSSWDIGKYNYIAMG